MIRMKRSYSLLPCVVCFLSIACKEQTSRVTTDFNQHWKFFLGDNPDASQVSFDDAAWRSLNLPHDWSIEGNFDENNPGKAEEGGLPAGTGWYRKSFTLAGPGHKHVFIDFDGIYRKSEVWINGHYLGKRPNGYISFRYDITPYVNGADKNVLAVRVDNSEQPNSRWYTGSGIYRNVHLITTGEVFVDHWGTFITTPQVTAEKTTVNLNIRLNSPSGAVSDVTVETTVSDRESNFTSTVRLSGFSVDSLKNISQEIELLHPALWSIDDPHLYKAIIKVFLKGDLTDTYETIFGIRDFQFDSEKGFSLNGESLKIHGVCMHHDLGALGAAVNKRAIERQLELLKAMGCNAIRTAHNPPAPELLDLCDSMGFLVMDEAFDVWKKKKVQHDSHTFWDEWHERDLKDMILRDRNHPSIIMWSIGNEIREQFDSTGIAITKELVDIVKSLDTSRPVVCALTENDPAKNFIYQSHTLDVLGFNYKHEAYDKLPELFPDEKIIASENMSALATRGHYDMPSDSIRRWPINYKTPLKGNADWTVSSYDNVSAYWGSTHEETLKAFNQHDYLAGLFVWTGFDYLGEPIPYPWPARSSYFGIIDLAGFPKDAWYLYQSEWADTPVLHVFPHWNWNAGDTVDVWAYYNNADEVELFVNGKSQGTRRKENGDMHVMWRIQYTPGTIDAVSRKDGKVVLKRTINTAGKPAKVDLTADRSRIRSDGYDLSFVTVKILDKDGNLVPDADTKISFEVGGEGFLAGTDNGYQASLESFKSNERKAFNGMCLAILQSNGKAGAITLKASAAGLEGKTINIQCE